MDLGVIVHSKFGTFIVGKLFGYAGLVLFPAVVLERRNIEEHMLAFGIKLRLLGGVQRIPTIPNLLKISRVNPSSGLLPCGLLILAETADSNRECTGKDSPKAQLMTIHSSLRVRSGVVA